MIETFTELFENVRIPEKWYVSVYQRVPFYGGPEEGGWWGEDVILEGYLNVPNEDIGKEVLGQLEERVKAKNDEARRAYGDKCLREMEMEERLGEGVLGEVDGETSYFAVVEKELGSHTYQGCRHYE